MRTTASLVLVVAACAAASARADSPLTSTDLYVGYTDLPAVAHVLQRRPSPNTGGVVADHDDIAFLLGDAASDEKLAVVSALGWGAHGTAELFLRSAAVRAHVPLGDLAKKNLRPIDKAVLGYILAMDDYFTLKSVGVGNDLQEATPMQFLAEAQDALATDFAVAYVKALVDAQRAMERDWCRIYKDVEKVVARFPEDKRNLRPAALAKSEEYIALYRDSCPDLKPAPEHAAELDQIYVLAQLGDVVVAGTQGGAVAWDTHSHARVSIAVDFICNTAIAYKGSVFVGCRNHAWRFDGKQFQRIWTSERKDADGLVPLVRPNGDLVFLEGKKAQRWMGDKLVVEGAAEAPNAYQRAYAKDGTLWWIDFLHALVVGSASFPLHGPVYPGRDPREIVVDGKGRMWVLDFEDGIFRVVPDATGMVAPFRFSKEPGVASKGSGVAVDDARNRTWLLHYTDGLVLVDDHGAATKVAVPHAEFMRALLLADDGTAWVGGWHGLVRVDPSTLAVTTVPLH